MFFCLKSSFVYDPFTKPMVLGSKTLIMKEIRIIIIIIPEILFEREYYFQRKHKDKYKFPLIISIFLYYFQRKYAKRQQFPLVIETFLLYLQRKSD